MHTLAACRQKMACTVPGFCWFLQELFKRFVDCLEIDPLLRKKSFWILCPALCLHFESRPNNLSRTASILIASSSKPLCNAFLSTKSMMCAGSWLLCGYAIVVVFLILSYHTVLTISIFWKKTWQVSAAMQIMTKKFVCCPALHHSFFAPCFFDTF